MSVLAGKELRGWKPRLEARLLEFKFWFSHWPAGELGDVTPPLCASLASPVAPTQRTEVTLDAEHTEVLNRWWLPDTQATDIQ